MTIRHSKMSAGQAARFAEIDRLKAVNAELVAVLETLVDRDITYSDDSVIVKIAGFDAAINAVKDARAALAKAKDQS